MPLDPADMTEEQARELLAPHMLALTDAQRSVILREEHYYTPPEVVVPGVERLLEDLRGGHAINMSRVWVFSPKELIEIAAFFRWLHRWSPGWDFNLLAEAVHDYNNTSAVERLGELAG